MSQEIDKQNKLNESLEQTIQKARVGREESEDREIVLRELSVLEQENKKLVAELEKYKELDPDAYDQRKKDLAVYKEAANRWTDNIFTLQSYFSNKFNFAKSDFDSQFGIPDDFDYVE